DTSGSATVSYAVTGSGSAPANAADFAGGVLPAGSVSFAAGETSKTITVNVAGDSAVEASEGFTPILSSPSSGLAIGTASATGTIVNDDASVSVAAQSALKAEGNGGGTAFTFTVTRTGDASGSATVSYAVAGTGSAPANAADFAGGVLPAGIVSFAAGETSKTITVSVAADSVVEANEGFTVTLSSPVGGTIGTASATGSILNDDGTANQLVKAVNVGGGQVTASGGTVFEADSGPARGAAESQTFATTAAISGTTDDVLYQDERWIPGGSYTYEVPVTNGTYRVDLLLAEIYSGITGAGQRVFDMALEGQALASLQNIDIFSEVGANAAFTISQQVTVSDGSLSIQVGPGSAAAGNVENAKLNAFAVYAVSAPPSATLSIAAAMASQNEGNSGSTAFTFTVTRTGDTSGSATASYAAAGTGSAPANAADFAGGVLPAGIVSFAAGETARTITVNVAGDLTVEPSETFTVTLSPPSPGSTSTTIGTASAAGSILNDDSAGSSQLVTAVNVGGGQVTASNGVVFQADPGPTTGAAASRLFATTASISGTTDDALYQDERWTPGGSYTYEVAVANGTYRVDLLLAEIYWGITGSGQRVFDMALEGQALAALQNIDIYSRVGANAALTISQQVTVSDGSLSIQVGPGNASAGNVENAKLNAFAVYAVSAPPSATLSIAAAEAGPSSGPAIGTASATGTIQNDDVALPVAAHDDAYIVLQGQSLSVAAGVLLNDENAISATDLGGPAHGTLDITAGGEFSYTPAPGYFGLDNFSYNAGNAGSTDDAQALLYVVPVSTGPTTTLNLTALSVDELVASTYVAFFGRAADAGGFDFWTDEFLLGMSSQTPAGLFAN
ncbi:MAG: malectin domain-containing carbohydrate-binding protein, partial [Reyranella sp.]